jgi:probable HAF family extracellular repeat protein
MKSQSLLYLSAWLLAVLAVPLNAAAQEKSAQPRPSQPARYTVTDLGTLPGGNFSQPFFITKNGHVSGSSNLTGGTSHAVVWSGRQATDLGTLGGSNSIAFSANTAGRAAGEAETSVSDPNGEDFCGFGTHLICLPFESVDGVMNPLPTLGGNNGGVNMINRWGTAVGFAETSVPDPACPAPQVLHFMPAVWRDSKAHSLPTYPGDPDGLALAINDRGQIVGSSGTCTTFQPTLINLMGVHPIMWENGKPVDLGNLGGTTGAAGGNIAWNLNNRGQVIGVSDLAGDTTFHAFLWTKATGMQDLGTLPGDVNSTGSGINDAGDIVGLSLDQDFNGRAFLWHNGRMTDLNTLISAHSSVFLFSGCSINDRGQITGLGVTSAGEFHSYLLTPTDEWSESTPDAPR